MDEELAKYIFKIKFWGKKNFKILKNRKMVQS